MYKTVHIILSLYFSRHFFFFFNDTATTEIYTLSLHDALPISWKSRDCDWRDHNIIGPASLERLFSEVAWSFAWRHPHRARAFRVLFPHRHLHHSEHFAQSVLIALPALMSASGKQIQLKRHVAQLLRCRRCPRMESTPVSGGAVLSDVMLIGQAPGPREPVLKRPFAHTAGKTLFRWFEDFCGMNEAEVRATIYFAAVCRCFPGKNPGGTDRVPAPDQIRTCSSWMN